MGLEVAFGPACEPAPEPPKEEPEVVQPVDDFEVVEPIPPTELAEVVLPQVVKAVPPRRPPRTEPVKPVETVRAVEPAPEVRQVVETPPAAVAQEHKVAGPATSAAWTSGGRRGRKADSPAIVSAWLERHRQYPRESQRRRHQGTVFLRFVVDSSGKVLSYRIDHSSGRPVLDVAVTDLIQRAQPLPSMPPEETLDRLELVVPVQFLLR